MQTPDLSTIGARFGQPAEWARYHTGQHICVDGKNYIASCLVTDPVMESTARYFMERSHAAGAV